MKIHWQLCTYLWSLESLPRCAPSVHLAYWLWLRRLAHLAVQPSPCFEPLAPSHPAATKNKKTQKHINTGKLNQDSRVQNMPSN